MRRLLSLLALLTLAPRGAGATRPNIVFLLSDDHATSAISAYGPSHLSGFANTPNIDRIARDGMLFRNCYVANSICTPSRAAILTGEHSHHNGVYTLQDAIDPKKHHLAHWFNDAGYQTAFFGKWHLESTPQGFQTWAIYRGQGEYFNPVYLTPDAPKKGHVEQGYADDLTTDKALGWMEHRDPAKPFLLCLWFKSPHRNWMPPPRYLSRFKDDTIPEPGNLLDDWSHRSVALSRNHQTVGRDMRMKEDLKDGIPAGLTGDALRKAAYQHYAKDYVNTAQAMDDNVGRVLDWLKANGLDQDTIVVYSSDQGFFVGEHGLFDKRWMYEESEHMPLIIRAPGLTRPGSECRELVSNIDFAPTLLSLAGIAAPSEPADRFDGASFAPMLSGSTPAGWRDAVYYRYWEHNSAEHPVPGHFGIRTATHKIICYQGQPHGMKAANPKPTPEEWELFDLVKDPHEMRNVYDDPAYAQVRAELTARLKAERERIGDTR